MHKNPKDCPAVSQLIRLCASCGAHDPSRTVIMHRVEQCCTWTTTQRAADCTTYALCDTCIGRLCPRRLQAHALHCPQLVPACKLPYVFKISCMSTGQSCADASAADASAADASAADASASAQDSPVLMPVPGQAAQCNAATRANCSM
jgi:hypothetical protein